MLWRTQNATAGPGKSSRAEQGQCVRDGKESGGGGGGCGDEVRAGAGAGGHNLLRYTGGTDDFVTSKPRIILLLLFFHPQMTRMSIC